MAPVIFGLNLGDMQWSKFKSSYMWNQDYHLRRSKFICYQLAMIFCVVSESLGTAALSHYLDQQTHIQREYPGVGTEYNDDYIGAASFNIFVGIYVAFIFGGGFFFDLFFPERREARGVRIAWRCCSVAASLFAIGDVIAFTVIVASRSARITGIDDPAEVDRLVAFVPKTPLLYRSNGHVVASLVFLWLGWPFVVASTAIMWASLRHDEAEGPLSSRAQQQRERTRRDVEAAGGTFELAGNRNVYGYHDKGSQGNNSFARTPSNASSDEAAHHSTTDITALPAGRPVVEERTYTGT